MQRADEAMTSLRAPLTQSLASPRLTRPPARPAARPPARRLVKYVESTPEPFTEEGSNNLENPNPWTQQVVATACCVVS